MKGITPVIAVILLLLVTIAIVGFAFGFFQRIFGLSGAGVENQTTSVIQRTAQTINIDNVGAAKNNVTIRNTGTVDINANTEINVFVGGAKVVCAWSPGTTALTTISPKTASSCSWGASPPVACLAGTIVKVVAPGNEDSRTC